jgi:hypothetical protein
MLNDPIQSCSRAIRMTRIWLLMISGLLLIVVALGTTDAIAQSNSSSEQFFRQNLLSNSVELFVFRSFQMLLTAIAAVLLFGTALVKQHARFLRYLSAAYAITFVAVVAVIISSIFLDQVAERALAAGWAVAADVESAMKLSSAIKQTAVGIDLTLSFCSSFCMLVTWYLLNRYPEQGISNEFFATWAGILGLLITLAQLITGGLQNVALPLIEIVDTVTSAVVLVLVGVGLWNLYPAKRAQPLPLGVLLSYVLWAFANLFYWFVIEWLPSLRVVYGIIIFFIGFATAVITVIYTSLVFTDKSGFNVGPTPPESG